MRAAVSQHKIEVGVTHRNGDLDFEQDLGSAKTFNEIKFNFVNANLIVRAGRRPICNEAATLNGLVQLDRKIGRISL
jgi:hypothetical protein